MRENLCAILFVGEAAMYVRVMKKRKSLIFSQLKIYLKKRRVSMDRNLRFHLVTFSLLSAILVFHLLYSKQCIQNMLSNPRVDKYNRLLYELSCVKILKIR